MKRAVDPEGERKPTTFTSLPWKNDCVHRHEQVDASDKRLPVRKNKTKHKDSSVPFLHVLLSVGGKASHAAHNRHTFSLFPLLSSVVKQKSQ